VTWDLGPARPWRTVLTMPSSEQDPSAHAEPVVVAVVTDLGEAEIVQAKLRASGIEAFVDDQLEGGVLPVEGEPGVAILVRAADADDARIALDDASG
jgi:Putative prokaryotic signal transducing protein